MASSQYGITSAMSDMVSGYEGEQQRQAGVEKGAQETEMREMKLKQGRSAIKKEGVADAVRLILAGDLEGATAKYNEMGEDRMSELEFDPETGMVSFLDSEGTQRDLMIGQLMLSAGMDPNSLDTPDAQHGRKMEEIEQTAKMKKKYGIGTGGSQSKYIQDMEYNMKMLTGGDPRKAFELNQLSKSSPETAYAKILLELQKQNKDKYEDKMTDKQMQDIATQSVTAFRKGMLDKLMGKEKPEVVPAPAPLTPQELSTGTVNRAPTGKFSFLTD